MEDIKPLLRKAYLDALSGLAYLGVSIPVDQEFLTKVAATLPVGNSTQAQAYVIIQNQTVNDDSAKCGINQDTSLQLDIVTVFNANSGNSYHAEQIANNIFAIIFPGSVPSQSNLTAPGITIWRKWLEGSRIQVQETSTSRIFRNILIFNHSAGQSTT